MQKSGLWRLPKGTLESASMGRSKGLLPIAVCHSVVRRARPLFEKKNKIAEYGSKPDNVWARWYIFQTVEDLCKVRYMVQHVLFFVVDFVVELQDWPIVLTEGQQETAGQQHAEGQQHTEDQSYRVRVLNYCSPFSPWLCAISLI